MAKGDFQKGVSELMKARGCTRKVAMDAYRKGERANVLSEAQESIAGVPPKEVSPAELVQMADTLLRAAGDKGKAQSVLNFVAGL